MNFHKKLPPLFALALGLSLLFSVPSFAQATSTKAVAPAGNQKEELELPAGAVIHEDPAAELKEHLASVKALKVLNEKEFKRYEALQKKLMALYQAMDALYEKDVVDEAALEKSEKAIEDLLDSEKALLDKVDKAFFDQMTPEQQAEYKAFNEGK